MLLREDTQIDAPARALAAELGRELRGEVRADAYTRHLFASDASLYSSAPLLVAFPRDAADVVAAVQAAARFEVPVVTRGAGTSLAGQAAGQGLVLDTSRHMDAIGEVDLAARRVRVGPGVVQEDLNRAAAPHGLGFGPDTSTSNRATLGGMIGNNSSGSHSIVYGTTIDHVHELEVVLADGSTARLGPVDEAERARRAQADTLEGAIYRGLPEILREHARAIAEDYPRHWRQSGGYRLDRLAREFDLARFVTGSEGTLVAITEATVGLVELPKAKMFAVGHFDSVDAAIAATEDALALEAAAIEMIDSTILELSRSKREYAQMASTIEGEPAALLFVTFFGDTPEEAGAQLDRLEAAWREHGHGYHFLRAESAAEQDALTKVRKAGLGLLMAASRLAPPGRVRRGHRGRARAAGGVRQGVPRGPRPPRPQGRLLRPLPRSAACTSGPSSTSPRRAASRRCPPSRTRSPSWWRTSTASTRASTATGACAARSTRACSATTSTRRCGR